jgi:hypothetical protein
MTTIAIGRLMSRVAGALTGPGAYGSGISWVLNAVLAFAVLLAVHVFRPRRR